MRPPWIALVALGAGCFDPSPPLDLPCGSAGECPEGQRCDPVTSTCIPEAAPDIVAVAFEEAASLVDEGGARDVAIVLTGPSATEIMVTVAITGSAVREADYTLSADTVVFAPGSTREVVSIVAIDEAIAEPDETIELTLSEPAGAVLGDAVLHVATLADAGVPVLRFAILDSDADEGDDHPVTVELSRPAAGDVTFRLFDAGGSTSGADFVLPGPITIPEGATSIVAYVAIVDDALDEFEEDLDLELGEVDGEVTYTFDEHEIDVADDDPPPQVRFDLAETDGGAAEGATGVSAAYGYEVRLTAPSGKTITVPVSLGGTATDDVDYTVPASDMPLVFPAGDVAETITITVIGDATVEANETVIMTLGAPTNATPGSVTVRTHTITSDD